MGDIEKIDLSNFCETSEEEGEINEIKDAEKKELNNSKKLFFQHLQMIDAILFVVRFNEEQKTDCCNLEALKDSIDNNLFIQLNQEKFNITLDYQLMS